MRRRAWQVGAVLAASSIASRGAAQQPTSEVRLSWARGDGAESCIDSRELAERVRARLGRDPFEERAELSIEGVVTRGSTGYRAELRVRDGSRAQIGWRELSSPERDCAALGEAVALAVALTIDPNAASLPAESTPGAGTARSEPLGLWTDNPVVACPPAPSCPAPAPCPACEKPLSDRASFAARAVIAGGILPGASPGAALSGTYGGAALRGTAGILYLPERELPGRPFSFGLTSASLGACWVPVREGRLEGALCAEAQVGATHAVVRQLTPLEPGDHLWLAAGAGPWLSMAPVPPLLLQAGITAVVPLARRQFAVRGEPVASFESAPVGALGFVGVGVTTP